MLSVPRSYFIGVDMSMRFGEWVDVDYRQFGLPVLSLASNRTLLWRASWGSWERAGRHGGIGCRADV